MHPAIASDLQFIVDPVQSVAPTTDRTEPDTQWCAASCRSAVFVQVKGVPVEDFSNPTSSRVVASTQPSSPLGTGACTSVHGWLLVLCLTLTVIGPLISAWLMANEYAVFAPYFASSTGLQAAILVSLAITASSVAFGICAGLRLWLIRPNAVTTAKYALLAGLAADIVTTMIGLVAGPTLDGDDRLLRQLTTNLIPSLIFFTVCFAYLNKSSRVSATYPLAQGDA